MMSDNRETRPSATGHLVVPDYMKQLVDRLRQEDERLLKKLSLYDLQTIARPYVEEIQALQNLVVEASKASAAGPWSTDLEGAPVGQVALIWYHHPDYKKGFARLATKVKKEVWYAGVVSLDAKYVKAWAPINPWEVNDD